MSYEGEQGLVDQMDELGINRRWKRSHGYQMRQNLCDQLTSYKKVIILSRLSWANETLDVDDEGDTEGQLQILHYAQSTFFP